MPAVSRTRRTSHAPQRARRNARTRHARSPIKLRAWWRTARHRPAVRRGVWAAGLAVPILCGIWIAWPEGGFGRWHRDFAQWTAGWGLKVERVTVRGRLHTDSKQILASVGVRRGDPILSVDPERVRKRLESLDWVAEADVVRQLPDAVHIEIVERHPFALWQRDKRLTLVDRGGRPITEEILPEADSLPLVVGEGAADHAAALISLLTSEPDLYRRVRAAVWVGERRWNLRLSNGIDVRLPEQDPASAWHRLARLEREHRLLEREIQAVDLRLPDRLIVQMTNGIAEKRRNPGEDT